MIAMRLFLCASQSICLGVASAQALPRSTDLVIDDFDEPVSIALPVSFGSGEVVQTDIGPLSADRRTDVIDLNVRAQGQFGTANSALTVNIPRATPKANVSIGLLGLSLATEYTLPTVLNLPKLGYDAMAVDFRSMDASLGYLPRVDASLRTAQQQRLLNSIQFDISASDSSFTLLFPLNTFADRGGVGGDDFDDVVSVWFRVYPVFLTGASPDMTFSMQIERIRFTTLAVPEPSGVAFLAVGLLATSSRRGSRTFPSKPRR